MPARESTIQLDIMRHLRKQGLLFWRFSPETYNAHLGRHIRHDYIPDGLPDLMVLKAGQFYGLECKRPKGKASAAQVLMKKRFELEGAKYCIVRSIEDVDECLNK